ncbi:MAG: hypothetical protein A2074_04795 [Candidatus Aquicultor primus]|uniref:YqeG family HAD IIIA-type phosphatase n=1 Tax=Candidatus Aquicultor primus TaxID=1797195 RepID=A0A1F2UN13_9ACTN|nr:MAG: hypothetical protein A2074_04795 [Candidatus Aquicultor primus]
MLKLLYPDSFVKTIFEIDIEELKARGIRGLILDLDNTIVPRNSAVATDELKEWLSRLEKQGMKACILSNNWKQRVSSIAAQVGLPLVARAAKPRRGAFVQAMKVLGTGKEETVVIGDQLFTDVLGGNLAGIHTILVVPMSNHEAPHTKILRKLERRIMKSRTTQEAPNLR